MIKVLVADKLAEQGLERLRQRPEVQVDVKTGLGEQALASTVGQYDGMIIRSGVRVTAKALSNPGRLRAIARAGVGVDNVDLTAATRAGVLVMNTPDANTISTAELTMALMLAISRRLPEAHAHVLSGQWQRSQYVGVQLAGKTLGLIGFGRVGRAVAARALGFEMRVLAYDPFFQGQTAMEGKVTMVSSLPQLLKRVDYLSIHAPKTDKTAGMIGREQLAMMKDGVRIVNTARGGIVDEQALAEALDSGKVAAAGIDVYTAEPPTGNPLLRAKNVVLTPHLGASTREAQQAVSVEAAEVLLDYLCDEEIRSAVNVVGVPAVMSARDRAYVDLANRMGRILSPLCGAGVSQVRVAARGDSLQHLPAALGRYCLVELLSPYFEGRLNVINVEAFAQERGIDLGYGAEASAEDFTDNIVLSVRDGRTEHSIEGTVFIDGLPRILAINGYRMNMVPEGPMVLIFNDDQPGAIGLVGTTFGQHGVNIADMTLSRQARTALMVLKLDEPPAEPVLQALRQKRPPIQLVHNVTLPAATRAETQEPSQ
ncbi:MAG: phosphoglycerate dehydrogenase [Phycisphaerae bacterium]